MLFRMRGSVLLAVLGVSLAGCSVLLDWSDYTGGVSTGGATVDAPDGVADSATVSVRDASRTVVDAARTVLDAAPTIDAQDSGPSDDEDAATCNLSACPTNTCDITVYFHACCMPDGGCGCQSTIPTPGACMGP
jgi:hypothetical protein